MTHDQALAAVKAARKDFKKQMWGHDDDTAVDAYIKLLKQHLKEQDPGPPPNLIETDGT